MYAKRTVILGAAVAGLATLATCSKKSDPVDPAAVNMAETVCPRAYECCTPMQLKDNDLAGTDVASCKSKTAEAFDNFIDSVLASEKKGRSDFQPDRLARCLAFIKAADCPTLRMTNHFSGVPNCGDFVEPKVTAGGACSFDWECIGNKCEKAQSSQEGTCTTTDASAPPQAASADAGSGGAADQCFYTSACSYGGHQGRPTPLPIIILLAIPAAGLIRRAFRPMSVASLEGGSDEAMGHHVVRVGRGSYGRRGSGRRQAAARLARGSGSHR